MWVLLVDLPKAVSFGVCGGKFLILESVHGDVGCFRVRVEV
jgi:hypothetical protein